ncbi:MAG: hypothetical protein Q4F74_05890 [Synergistaceae bacterium]|nr:hypothetical protein [Synergistaceae bacterium]
MKKYNCFVFAVILVILTSVVCFAKPAADVEGLLKDRQSICWVEGTVMGDMVLGARGTVQFIYLDEALSRAIVENNQLAPWVDDLNQYFGSERTNKKELFLIQVETYKPWNVDISKFIIGNYHPTIDDVLSPSVTRPLGNLESGLKLQMAVVVPQSEVKPGKTVKLGYDKDTVEWKAPK